MEEDRTTPIRQASKQSRCTAWQVLAQGAFQAMRRGQVLTIQRAHCFVHGTGSDINPTSSDRQTFDLCAHRHYDLETRGAGDSTLRRDSPRHPRSLLSQHSYLANLPMQRNQSPALASAFSPALMQLESCLASWGLVPDALLKSLSRSLAQGSALALGPCPSPTGGSFTNRSRPIP